MADNKKNTEALVLRVRTVLNGGGLGADEAYTLAKQLISLDAHYWARRLLLEMLSRSGITQSQREKLAQGLALATYKDSTLLRQQAFDKALEVLAQAFKLEETKDQETLGLIGAIYKRRWRLDGRRQWLDQSLHYYRRGFERGVQGDQGYTAINAAFIQDVLAELDEQWAAGSAQRLAAASERCKDARAIRQAILTGLEKGILALSCKDPGDYWPIATLAEAYFGLGEFDKAGEQLARANQVPDVADWMRRSTVEQLVQLTQVQLGSSDPNQIDGSPQWAALKRLIGEDCAPAVQTMFSGKVGLALSGGGFRASLYHLGVLAKLAELDMLRHVEVLSCVSGGSIVGAHYYLELRRLIQCEPPAADSTQPGRRDQDITQQDYIDLVAKLIDDFLDGVQKNLRMRVLANPLANLKMLFLPSYSRTERLGELYEKHLYGRVADDVAAMNSGLGRWRRMPRRVRDLIISPPDEAKDFRPAKVNWRRRNKIPELVLNATTLNTGHVWQFTATWMGESPNIINRDVDKNQRFRRLYHDDAPKRYKNFRLGHAVAASSCVPGLFEPIEMPDLYDNINVRLVDGGVYDNLGVASLAEQDCSVMIVSDASGQLSSDDDPAGGMLGPLMRSTSVMMHRIRGAEYDDLQTRADGGLLKSFAYVHLTQGLDAKDVDWKGCELPGEQQNSGQRLTSYDVRCDVQGRLATMRTDLDSFTDIEGYALMYSGYRAMGEAAEKIKGFELKQNTNITWKFLDVDRAMESASWLSPGLPSQTLDRHLKHSHRKFLKVWFLCRSLGVAAIAIGIVLAGLLGYWVWQLWQVNPDLPLLTTRPAQWITGLINEALTLKNVLWTIGGLLVGYLALVVFGKAIGKRITQLLKLRSIGQRVAIGVGVGVIGWTIATIHLWVFDRLFVLLGRRRKLDAGS